ncbi:hypothetical protein [Streptacidiphilus monticola]|uniref:Secreted protein n=1 Tax=Streptacidiphilus monticola TaxID=2161674 RepID=A0ABW1FZ66_9ACTN
MRKVVLRVTAWAAATGAAVGVSWFGVHRVLRDDSFQQPRVLALQPEGLASTAASTPPAVIGVATQAPTPSPSPTRTAPSAHPHNSPARTAGSPAAGSSGQVTAYTPRGGRIVVSMGADSASLVTAVPDNGWAMHTWTGDGWLRVDFSQGSVESVFYVTWNGHPPSVQTEVMGG